MIKKEKLLPYYFLAPALGILLVLVIYPLIFSLRLSFSNFSFGMADSAIAFVGFKNFIRMFRDSYFLNGLRLTILYMFGTSLIAFVIGLGVSLLLQKSFFGKKVIMNILILPLATTPVVVGIVWRLLLMPDYSFVNYLLSLLGIRGPQWLITPGWALFSVMIAYVWEWSPFFIIMLSAGLASLPQEPYEAAKIDGATGWQTLRFITLPLLKPLVFLVLIIRMMDAFRVFDLVYSMTKGGPGRSTQILSYVVYYTGIGYLELGYASAMSYVMLVILVLLSIFLLKFVRST
ncbi:MAG: sugar ABC transporter permease [Candidatus Atribacteria bacterium]|nr:sugar ABC transporter permease [Candidatus Atribacteria bacterium]